MAWNQTTNGQVSVNSAFSWSLLLCNANQLCSSNVWVLQHRSVHTLDMDTIIILVCHSQTSGSPLETHWLPKSVLHWHSSVHWGLSSKHTGPIFIKPDQRNPWIKDQLGNDLLFTILHLQLPNFVSCGRDKSSHMTQNLVTVGVKL